MRIIIFTIVLTYSSLSITFAQWIIQPTGNIHSIRDVEFIDRYTGWACGDNHIYKTTNGGNNWIEQSHPDAFLIQQIDPVNDSVVYAAGWWSFMKTIDGGNNWFSLFDSIPSSQLPTLDALYFINENTGWLTGNIVVMKTTDGGLSFVDSMRIESISQDIYFKDSQTGIICGYSGGFVKTTDGGRNWNYVDVIQSGPLYDFVRLAVVNDSIVLLASKPVYRSTDFGNTWDSIGYIPSLNFNVYMYGVTFPSIKIGYTSGNMGEMYKTTDGGYNWQRENSGISTSIIYDMEAFSDSVVWASRGNGTILNTTTGGQVRIELISTIIPKDFKLYSNYPNPFNSNTITKFDVSKSGRADIIVYNVLGIKVKSVFQENITPGSYQISFDASELPSGTYFCNFVFNGKSEGLNTMILIK